MVKRRREMGMRKRKKGEREAEAKLREVSDERMREKYCKEKIHWRKKEDYGCESTQE